MRPPAPGRLSTSTGAPISAASSCPSWRATKSAEPPAAKPTTSRTGCPWAQLRLAAQGDKVVVDAAQAASNWRREIMGDGAFGEEGLRKRQGRRGRRGRF